MGFLLRAKTNTQARTPLNLKAQGAFALVLLSPKREAGKEKWKLKKFKSAAYQ